MYFPSATLNAPRAGDSTHTEKNLLSEREQILVCKGPIPNGGLCISFHSSPCFKLCPLILTFIVVLKDRFFIREWYKNQDERNINNLTRTWPDGQFDPQGTCIKPVSTVFGNYKVFI